MDRQIIYPGAIPLETDLLGTNKNAMIGLSKLAAAILGTGTMLNGLACTPNSPAALNVLVAPGEIYSLQNIDGTAYSSIAADTTHSILKQGISLDTVTLSCPAPVTSGYSINYLVQVAYQDADTNAVVLPYYNASNPAQAYSGPNNSGTAQNTVRNGFCAINVKAGAAATTGTQTTPAADDGYTGAFVVTVANGQTTITSGNIAAVVGAPFITNKLTQLAPLASPALTGTPTAPTAAAGTNTTQLATTALVRLTGLSASGVTTVTTTSTLAASTLGGTVLFNSASAIVPTLPAASSMYAGSRIEMMNINAGVATVTRAGTDVITVNGSTVTTIALGAGDTLTLESNGATGWYAVGGSAQLGQSGVFGSSLGASGYQKLPSGLIIQWGTFTPSAGTGAVTTAVTFPMAFPNQCYSVTTAAGGSGDFDGSVVPSITGFSVTTYDRITTSAVEASAHFYMAIGR